MSIISRLCDRFKIIYSEETFSPESIDLLKKFSLIEVPQDYLDIIKEKAEIEMHMDDKSYLCVWGPDRCIENNELYCIQKYIPKSLAIGGDGGSAILIYMFGEEGFGLYLNWVNDLDIDESIKIASSLKEFLIDGVGIDILKENC